MEKVNISELDNILGKIDSYDDFEILVKPYSGDLRKGILKVIERHRKRILKLKELDREYENHLSYEREFIGRGFSIIAGIDEVGRGPLAGPVYAAAVILDPNNRILGIRDSKKLTKGERETLSEKIKSSALAYSIASASVEEIDRLNILNATKLAMKRAVNGLKIKPDALLIDAITIDISGVKQVPIIKGDDLSVSIGAASIIAKVERDSYMDKMSIKYPEYNFEGNKGYGTKVHIEAIKKYGASDIHRRTFIKNFI